MKQTKVTDYRPDPDLPKVERLKLTDFQPDPENANSGSERGTRMLEDSISLVGAARSGFADRNRIVLGGNKTQEALINSGIEDVIVVHTNGKEWVIVQRDDLDLLNDPDFTARIAKILDNRTSEVSLTWQPEVLESYRLQGVPLDKAWTPVELEQIGAVLPDGFREFDESVENDVEYITCPHCGEQFPK